ncbi:MAG: hypothetical protein IT348_03445 [Candidatus Eisenbacteria bacterium]|nr:hypothetical protein [Candidatus Eisenbacteria bacterium]
MRALAFLFLLGLVPSPAAADWPWPYPNSTLPSQVRLVTWNGAAPDAALGQFTVIIRDLANNPVPGSTVSVDFTSVPEVRIAADQMDPEALTICGEHRVRKLTGADGSATFTIMGSVSSAPARLGEFRVPILADGMLLGTPMLAVFDLDGAGGIGANDMSVWLEDFSEGLYRGRGDYDGDQNLGANDLSVLLSAQGAGGSSVGISTYCP